MLCGFHDIARVAVAKRLRQKIIKDFRVVPVVAYVLGKNLVAPNFAVDQAFAPICVVDAYG
jgi:hypothetical protein